MTDLESRLERRESIVDSQHETIDNQQATIRRQRERIAALEAEPRTGSTETDDGSAVVDRRDALQTGGLLALLVGGVGTVEISGAQPGDRDVQFGPVADLDDAVATLDLPVTETRRPERDAAVVVAAALLALVSRRPGRPRGQSTDG